MNCLSQDTTSFGNAGNRTGNLLIKHHLETSHTADANKPVDFLGGQKCYDYRGQQSRFVKTASTTTNAQLASYKVAYRIAQSKKPHTVAGELILPAAIDMVAVMIDEASAHNSIPMSNSTIARRITDISEDMKEQLTEHLLCNPGNKNGT